MRLLLRRLEWLRDGTPGGAARVQLYVSSGCVACERAKNSQLHVRLAHALRTRVDVVDCSRMGTAELAALRQRGVHAVPSVAFRLLDGTHFVVPAQRVEAMLSVFRGDARIFRAES